MSDGINHDMVFVVEYSTKCCLHANTSIGTFTMKVEKRSFMEPRNTNTIPEIQSQLRHNILRVPKEIYQQTAGLLAGVVSVVLTGSGRDED